MTYDDEGENPDWDPDGAILQSHFSRAVQIWQTLLPGTDDVYLAEFKWSEDPEGSTLGTRVPGMFPKSSIIKLNRNWQFWFADPTPGDDVEFDTSMPAAQKVYSDLAAVAQVNWFPGTAPPSSLEVGFQSPGFKPTFGVNVPTTASNQLDAQGELITARTGSDLLTVILHELGHALGVDGTEPGAYNIYPEHVGGLEDVLIKEATDDSFMESHFAGSGGAHWLMQSVTPRGFRVFPSATDVFVIAEDESLPLVRLDRVGSHSSGLWSDSSRWMGTGAPDTNQSAYISHSGFVMVDNDVQVRELYVGDAGGLSVPTHELEAHGLATIDGAANIFAAGSLRVRGANHHLVVGALDSGRLDVGQASNISVEYGDLVVGDRVDGRPGGSGIVSAAGGTITVYAGDIVVGREGGSGVLSVDGASIEVHNGDLLVGHEWGGTPGSVGSVTFKNSSRVTVHGDLLIGAKSGTTGVLDVIDPNSTVTVDGFAGVGGVTQRGGVGSLALSGAVIVRERATIWDKVSLTSTGVFSADILRNENGSWTIAHDGRVRFNLLENFGDNIAIGGISAIGIAEGATGQGALVRDAFQRYSSDQGWIIGDNARAQVEIINGGSGVAEGFVHLGKRQGSGGTTLTVSGMTPLVGSSELRVNGIQDDSLIVGVADVATMNVSSKGYVKSGGAWIARENGASGSSALISGEDSRWDVFGGLVVGGAAEGRLTIELGGDVDVNETLFIGGAPTDGGFPETDRSVPSLVRVTGSGSTFESNFAHIGYNLAGKLVVESGAAMHTISTATIGSEPLAFGSSAVVSTSATWNIDQYLDVGHHAPAALAIHSAGRVDALNFALSKTPTSAGSSTVVSNAGVLDIAQGLHVGEHALGILSVANIGNVRSGADTILGRFSDGTGAALVSGSESRWDTGGAFVVGDQGSGLLRISDGAEVASVTGLVGFRPTGRGVVEVTGADSSWTISGGLNVGDFGIGSLTIVGGAKVSNVTGNISRIAGSDSSVTVRGLGSQWTNVGDMAVGTRGRGRLTVSEGGSVSNFSGYVGSLTGALGKAVIKGGGSTWVNHGELNVGYQGRGTLEVTGGGTVTTQAFTYVGRPVPPGSPPSQGDVTVDGEDSLLASGGGIQVGANATIPVSTVRVTNGGMVSSVGNVEILQSGRIEGVGTIAANVANGGVLAPGDAVSLNPQPLPPRESRLSIGGNYTQAIAGQLEFELASPTLFDSLEVSGNVGLAPLAGGAGPTLEITLFDGYLPLGNLSFDILDWGGSFSGAFAEIILPSNPQLAWNTSRLYTEGVISVAGPTPGDFNLDGGVDGADFLAWQRGLGIVGTATVADGDANGDGNVDGADLTIWKTNYATVSPVAATVPEPAGAFLCFAALLALNQRVRRVLR